MLPAGPTVVDILANGALYYGLVRALADQERPVWSRMSFATAEENFTKASIKGIDAEIFWPGYGDLPVTELVQRWLLPLAHEGLAAWGVDATIRGRLLDVIEQRCVRGVNGATWQAAVVAQAERRGLSRVDALREMTLRYVDLMHSNEPVHLWEV